MTDWLLGLVPIYGIWLVAAATYLSCLALPVPTSVIMLAAGGFVGSGDLALAPVVAAGIGGAVAGDQTGYHLSRRGGGVLLRRLAANPARAAMIAKAADYANRRGVIAVFLTPWLLSPLGPWINFVAGATGMGWAAFTIAGIAGEAVWVGLYVGMGQAFAGSIENASAAIGNLLGFIFAGAAALGLGWWLLRSLRSGQPG